MQLEIRNNALHISGYVNAVERESLKLPKRMCSGAKSDFYEKISAGAFRRALERAPEVRLMYNHTRDIGGTADGSLKLSEDSIGLRAEATITDSEVVRAAENGELRGWSFGFTHAKDRWEDVGDGVQRRTLDDFDLCEVSVLSVTPAYVGTSIEFRGENISETEMRFAEDAGTLAKANDNKARIDKIRHELELLSLEP